MRYKSACSKPKQPVKRLRYIAGLCLVLLLTQTLSINITAEPVTVGSRDFSIRNDIDKHVLLRLREEKIEPSAACTDEEFCRRAFLDVCGLIPSRAQIKAFLADKSPDRRAALVESLLNNERYADHWSVMWSDLLREHTNSRPQEGTERGSYRQWIQESLAKNMPYDQFARELITSRGSSEDNPAANFYLRDESNRVETTNTLATAFMGTRLECAQCHDHPFDKWTQYDFHSVMAFFGRTMVVPDPVETLLRVEQAKGLPDEVRKMLEPQFKEAHESNKAETAKLNEAAAAGDGMSMGMMGMGMAAKGMGKGRDFVKEMEKTLPPAQAQRVKQIFQQNQVRQVLERPLGEHKMPAEGDSQDKKKQNSGEVVQPVFPWDPSQKAAPTDFRRKALADFTTSSRQFAEVQVNRLWARLMGKGLVDPVDDFRAKNPPSHPEVLSYLADEFIKAKFDNKQVLRLILNSSTYQRSSMANASNRNDRNLFSHQRLRRLTAEQLFDSILVATGREKGMTGTKVADVAGKMRYGMDKNEPVQWAVDLPTPAKTGSFMNSFNQPSREQTVARREESGSITQALELLNGKALNDQLRGSLLIKSLLESKAAAAEIVTDSYLSILSRKPTPDEMRFSLSILKVNNPARDAIEDLHWGLLNAREFAFIK